MAGRHAGLHATQPDQVSAFFALRRGRRERMCRECKQTASLHGVLRICCCPAGMPQPGGVAALFQSGADSGLKDPQREAALSNSSIPHIVVKAGIIEDVPGGTNKLSVSPFAGSSSSKSSSISREDLASALVASAVHLPSFGGSSGSAAPQLAFEVRAAGPGQPPQDWEQLLEGLAVSPVMQ